MLSIFQSNEPQPEKTYLLTPVPTRLKSACASAQSDQSTLQPLYNMVRYNTVLDITQFKDGSQKCIDYIEK